MSPRHSRRVASGRRPRSVLMPSGGSAPRRRRSRRPRRGGGGLRLGAILRAIGVIVVLAAIAGGVVVWQTRTTAAQDRRDAAERFTTAWARSDWAAMWRALTPAARTAHPEAGFAAANRNALRAAGVDAVRIGRLGRPRGGGLPVAVAMRTREFGTLRGTVLLPVSGSGAGAGVDWDPSLRLPGLRRGEAVHRRSGLQPQRAPVLAADGTALDATALGASIAGQAGAHPTGLQRRYNDRLGGHPSGSLMFGKRTIARTQAVRGRSVHTTIRPRLMQQAAAALGGKLGGVAVIQPRDGAVLALAGLAVSAPQPPGSTFKIITASAALAHRLATPSSRYPVRTFATLSGVKLRNASGEACGGSLTEAFTASCNSVFAPLGAKVGARRLVAMARSFGFEEQPNVPAAKPSTIGSVAGLRDDLAVGAAAIGQDRDLATPLEMASVGATIALGGRRARPRITTLDPVVRHRAVSTQVADQVRSMMLNVVRSGTGTAAAIPGVQIAGKTGTAELRPNSRNPKDADAWFVAFAPAMQPKVAVAVLVVGAGFGGTAAAPIAKKVLAAALAGA
jgi:peptidoglycan glycosyltransferase